MGFRLMLGIDPGTTGAMSVFVDSELVHVGRLPIVERRATATRKGGKDLDTFTFAKTVRTLLRDYVGLVHAATIEEVGTQRMGQCGPLSLAKLARIAALIEGTLVTLGFTVHRTPPKEWKAFHGLKGADKAGAIALAKRRHPWLVLDTLASADLAEAVLIGEYGVHAHGDR